MSAESAWMAIKTLRESHPMFHWDLGRGYSAEAKWNDLTIRVGDDEGGEWWAYLEQDTPKPKKPNVLYSLRTPILEVSAGMDGPKEVLEKLFRMLAESARVVRETSILDHYTKGQEGQEKENEG